jgi:surface protein
MSMAFMATIEFDSELSAWDTSSVVDFSQMFALQPTFNANLGNWNVSSAETIEGMFKACTSFNRDISAWDVSRVKSFVNAFGAAKSFNQNLCAWGRQLNYSGVETRSMFKASACMNTESPNPAKLAAGPFCRSCEE